MDDDFNTVEAMAVLFELASEVNKTGSGDLAGQLYALGGVLGLLQRDPAVFLQGEEVAGLDDATLTLRRRTTLGFVFQFHHLLPAFTALENVTLPALMRDGAVSAERRAQALAMLRAVGLEQAAAKRPGELSGGMQQRVAIARALVLQPPLVLADEPTGNLDTASSDEVFKLMRHMHATLNTAFLIVTHDPRLAARCDRVIELVDGRIQRDERQTPAGADNPASGAATPTP